MGKVYPHKQYPHTCPQCQSDFTSQSKDQICCSRRCGSARRTKDPVVRFWLCVQKSDDPDGCWLWTGHKDRKGYGLFKLGSACDHSYRHIGSHRYSYILVHGAISDNLNVCHNCPDGQDRPDCVNPSHLFLGTQHENMQDMARKKRSTAGERSAQSKLTAEQIRQIQSEYVKVSQGHGNGTELAHRYNVNQSTISRIVNGKRWNNFF